LTLRHLVKELGSILIELSQPIIRTEQRVIAFLNPWRIASAIRFKGFYRFTDLVASDAAPPGGLPEHRCLSLG
jgi:hypothetical protein